MRLKRLEMIGFKSFAQRTIVELNPGITAVVGPNGCGKSNIVDALRWAMGEQSARHLRGQQMEDVVFNGSDSLPATGMAEVSIIFDNEDGRSPAEYSSFSEIMVTRRLFRSGESEYAINKVGCRLKDVVELFLGTGVGSKAYSIVEQGKVDELVNSKPEERRGLIEEAAGTSKYKSRKTVAEKKLERTHQNLLRVTDIVREIERQIRSMELQAKKAERYRALKSELKEKDLAFTFLQREAFHQDISRQQAQLASVENQWAEILAALHAKEAENESVRLALLEADKQIGLQQETLYQRRTEIQTDEQKCDFFRKDLAQLDQSEDETRASLLQLEERTKTVVLEIEELEKAKESFIQLSLFEETFLCDKESELESLQEQIRSLQSALEREKEALIDAANQIANFKNDAIVKEKRRGEIGNELARSRVELTQTTALLAACETKIGETGNLLASCLEKIRERSLEIALATASIQSLGGALDEKEKKIACLKEHLQENRSRLASLEDIQRNYEGCQEGVRAIMLKKQQAASPNGIYGLVAEVIEAPEHYEKALTAVLGDRLQCVIVKGHQDGVEAIEYLKHQASGRSSFIPLELSRKTHKELPLGEAEVIAPMMDVISVKEGYHDVAEYLLSDVVVVRDLQAGLSLWNRNGYYSTLVTTEGEVIDPMGIVTGGSGAPLEASFLAQRRRIRDLSQNLAALETRLPQEEQESAQLKQELEQAETQKTLLTAESHRLEIERVRLELEKSSAERECERITQSMQALHSGANRSDDSGPFARRGNSTLLQQHANTDRGEDGTGARPHTKTDDLQRASPDRRSRRSSGDPVAHTPRSPRREKREYAHEPGQSTKASGRDRPGNRGASRTYRRVSPAPARPRARNGEHRRSPRTPANGTSSSRSAASDRPPELPESFFATGRDRRGHQRAPAARRSLPGRKEPHPTGAGETAARAAAPSRQPAGKIRCRA